MSFLTKIKRLWGLDKEMPVAIETSTNFSDAEPMPNLKFDSQIVDEEWPYWLSNEDALRDEGVIFGLSGTQPNEKIEVIHSIFKKHASNLIAKSNEINEKIAEINLKIENKHNQKEDIIEKIKTTNLSELKEENLLRVSVGLILGIGMAIGNYYIINQSLIISFPNSHQFIAWGVFLSGMFNLYNNSSIFHNEAKTNWRNLIEEIGLPLAASGFVLAFTISKIPLIESLAYFVFSFFTFLLSGKLLLGNIARLKTELKNFNHNSKLKKDKKYAQLSWKHEIESLDEAIEKYRVEKWRLLPTLNEIDADISKLNADKEALIGLFMSEYELAKNYQRRLKPSEIQKIIGE